MFYGNLLVILVRLEVPFTNMTNIVGKNREVECYGIPTTHLPTFYQHSGKKYAKS